MNIETTERLTSKQVQAFLDQLQIGESFEVTFLTNSGETREYSGALIPTGSTQGESIAFNTSQFGIKRFNINNVLSIGVI
tara:strand:- start:1232 stop:1471 length:240 start_codon:yes stop_codon:yes gene_type:complete